MIESECRPRRNSNEGPHHLLKNKGHVFDTETTIDGERERRSRSTMASLYSLLCVATILLSSARCNNGEPSVPQHKALFVFGDSLFDPGNNQYLTNGIKPQTSNWPYGETYFNYPTGRFSDGRILPDFIGLISLSSLFNANITV